MIRHRVSSESRNETPRPRFRQCLPTRFSHATHRIAKMGRGALTIRTHREFFTILPQLFVVLSTEGPIWQSPGLRQRNVEALDVAAFLLNERGQGLVGLLENSGLVLF
jgi:hypothetical protein